jgi:hypothetical protein
MKKRVFFKFSLGFFTDLVRSTDKNYEIDQLRKKGKEVDFVIILIWLSRIDPAV